MDDFLELKGTYVINNRINWWWQKEKWDCKLSEYRRILININEIEYLRVVISKNERLVTTEIGLKSGRSAFVKESIPDIQRMIKDSITAKANKRRPKSEPKE